MENNLHNKPVSFNILYEENENYWLLQRLKLIFISYLEDINKVMDLDNGNIQFTFNVLVYSLLDVPFPLQF